jgi:hypothetical protein
MIDSVKNSWWTWIAILAFALSPIVWRQSRFFLNLSWILVFAGCIAWQFTYILGPDEQLRISYIHTEEVVNGPTWSYCPPMRSAIVVKALTLVPAQWVRVRNLRDLHYTTTRGQEGFG